MKQQNRDIRFDITRILKSVENRRRQLVFLLILFPIYGVIFSPHESDLHLTFYLISFVILLGAYILYYSLKKRYVIDGVFLINKEFIQIQDNVILLENIEQINFRYEGYKGESLPLAAVGIGTFGFKDGANNMFEVKTKRGDVNKITFLINTNKDAGALNKYLLHFRKKGVNLIGTTTIPR